MPKKSSTKAKTKKAKKKVVKKTKKPALPKEHWEMLLWNAADHHVFFCADGSIFKNLEELETALSSLSKEAFAHHVTKDKNDFSTWIYDIIGDADLADELREIRTLKRTLNKVANRIKHIKKNIDKHHKGAS